jgi:hypothetical protein
VSKGPEASKKAMKIHWGVPNEVGGCPLRLMYRAIGPSTHNSVSTTNADAHPHRRILKLVTQLATPKPTVTVLVHRPRRTAGVNRGGAIAYSLAPPGPGTVNMSHVTNTVAPYMARPTSAFDLVEQPAGSYIAILL